jgi:hypothetical protein
MQTLAAHSTSSIALRLDFFPRENEAAWPGAPHTRLVQETGTGTMMAGATPGDRPDPRPAQRTPRVVQCDCACK